MRAFLFLGLVALVLFPSSILAQEADCVTPVPFEVEPKVAFGELRPEYFWFHPRAVSIPGRGEVGGPRVLMTLQKHLNVSDYYSGLWTMQSDDLGKHWTEPKEIPELAWVPDGDVDIAVCDVTPGWHPPTKKMVAFGAQVRYSKAGAHLDDIKRAHQTAYSIYDPEKETWTRWRQLEMPEDPIFDTARNACSDWIVEPNGTLLLPLYVREGTSGPYSVTVARFGFDGKKVTFIEHGNILRLNVQRGFCEPQLVKFQGTYYLSLRNDVKGYVTSSKDGLHFDKPKPWTFDDGTELGSYNTQQHWLTHKDGLFLVYTRRGANNDHIMRHRAPLFISQVDPQKLCIVRSTEKVAVPERGAALGNFGTARIDEDRSIITVGEGVYHGKKNPRGADGSIWTSWIRWGTKNVQPKETQR
jgi:hypothetical protein